MREKGIALLHLLKDAATLRRKRVASYGSGDKLVWFADVPRGRPECRSPFLTDNPGEFGDVWLEVRKKRVPTRPSVPEAVADWVRANALDQADKEPELLSEITVLIEKRVPDLDAPPESGNTVVEKVPELKRLRDHPEVEDAWLEYLVNKWEPWAEEMRRWQEVQRIYEDLDFMRRRLEESEERYELLLAAGLLQWRDSTGTTVKRHLLTAPAEITLDAARGMLTVVPAASFESFRNELDMLELQDQPRLKEAELEDQLSDLDIQAWDTAQVAQLLREIANRIRPDAQVDETGFKPAERADETLRVVYAPAIVLRERRPTAYETLINGFLKDVENNSTFAETTPWRRVLLEGDEPTVRLEGDRPSGSGEDRFLFPLPVNEEQRQIVHRLRAEPCVLVKGPPGTGKSHTIANLICHLLASGERVLVTAHAPKALTVLRGLLPPDIRDLCVTALGSSREDQKLLEESVRGILRMSNEWRGAGWADRSIEQTERDLQQLGSDLARVERRLRECREAETHSHSLLGGYQGTGAQIARRIDQERERFGWFPELASDEILFPLGPVDVCLLAEVHAQLTEENQVELRCDLGEFTLPDPDEFKRILVDLAAAEASAGRAVHAADLQKCEVLRTAAAEVLDPCYKALTALEVHAVRSRRVFGNLADEILKDLLVGSKDRWIRFARDAAPLLNTAAILRQHIGSAQIQLPSDVDCDRLRADARRRQDYFEGGRHRGLWIFAPRLIKETQYVEERCLVDSQQPRSREPLATLVDFLELKLMITDFIRRWPAPLPEISDPREAVTLATDLQCELQRLNDFFADLHLDAFACIPMGERATLASQSERLAWLRAIEAESACRHTRMVSELLEALRETIRRCQSTGQPHRCLEELAQAAQSRDAQAWHVAWEARERLRSGKKRFQDYGRLVAKLENACPGLGAMVRNSAGNPQWQSKLLELDKAWAWAGASAWIRRVSSQEACLELVQDFHQLQEKIEETVKKLAGLRAWRAFFMRLDDATRQNLIAWTNAVDRIGKGTGKHAYRHRRTARRYLMECIPKIPAWIMPLHKLWDMVDTQPGLFDTVIVDEASQAGIESLALLLLAKQIIVVGDDKQNSPEAVGVLEDDIARLAREHLSQFRFRDEFRPDTSLFDHAERTFGNLISLREHFRCVPEIIRFSNSLCYQDTLTPLRQAPPNRLPPLKSQFVRQGYCDGEGQRIHNRPEAEALVHVIQSLVEDPAYEGRTMGVIALQGHAQAERIEQLLAQNLDPKVIEERRLRCGETATFQGDERDIIFLSLVIAPNVQYRALNRLPDVRRFNVAMSRARDQVWLFHSIHQHDLSPEDLRRKLLRFFESPGGEALGSLSENLEHLERAVRGARRLGNQPEPYESWFEVDVALELLRKKYVVRPQVEVAEYRIDLVVEGVDSRLAVECDGDAWHGVEAYERDMARQRQLERAGWIFVRVRESTFYTNRGDAIQEIVEACEELGIRPVDYFEPQQSTAEPVVEIAVVPADSESTSEAGSSETESTTTEEDTSNIQSGPFTGYSEASGFLDPREASLSNIRAGLHQIIETDGPLTRASVYLLYVEGCLGLQRAGRAVRQALDRALGAMLRAGEIVLEDELGDGSPDGQVLRLAGAAKVRVRPAGRRDLLEIPPSELLAVLDRLFPTRPIANEDDETLLRSVLEYYGFSRLTRPRREYLLRVLQLRRTREREFGIAQEVREEEAV
jgi:very-short-patch-repair endonuclease